MNYHPLRDSAAAPRTIYSETAEPAPETVPLAGEVRADLAIVGGGLTGLSAALHAAEAGLRTVLLEAHHIGWGSSGRNEGQIVPAMKREPAEIERDFGAERGRRLVEAAGAAPDLVFSLIERFAMSCAAERCGIITAAHSPAGLERMRRRTAWWQAAGAPLEMLDRAATEAAIGGVGYLGASLDRRGGELNALGYVRGLARAAIGRGAAIHTMTPVHRLAPAAAGWRVEGPAGAVTAAHVLLCTNAYAGALWPGLERSLVPVRAYQLVTAPLGENVSRTILPGGHAMSDTRRIMLGLRRWPDGRLQLGGCAVTMGPDRAPFYGRVERRLRALFPQLDAVRWDMAWSGWMAMTPDRYPRLTELAPGLTAGFGYNGRGIALGTLMGRELARRAAGAALAELVIPAVPLRPFRFHPLRRPIVYALGHWYRLRDGLDRRAASRAP